jgi:hypothetical protein
MSEANGEYPPVSGSAAFLAGHNRGTADRNNNGPEPYPPHRIGTPDANDWIRGWRIGRYGFDRDEDRQNNVLARKDRA